VRTASTSQRERFISRVQHYLTLVFANFFQSRYKMYCQRAYCFVPSRIDVFLLNFRRIAVTSRLYRLYRTRLTYECRRPKRVWHTAQAAGSTCRVASKTMVASRCASSPTRRADWAAHAARSGRKIKILRSALPRTNHTKARALYCTIAAYFA
jgi:hypothetical protein